MTNPIVEAPGARAGTSGLAVFDSAFQLGTAVGEKDWLDVGLQGASTALGLVAAASDPLGTLIAAGLGWIMDHLQPIKGWFDDLTGNPEEVKAFAGTWHNVSTTYSDIEQHLRSRLNQLNGQSGPALTAYRSIVDLAAKYMSTMSTVAEGLSLGIDAAGVIVQFVHGLVRDTLSAIVGSICSYAAELVFTAGLATPLVIEQVSTKVSSEVGRISSSVTALVRSTGSLKELITALRPVLDQAALALPANLIQGKNDTEGVADRH